MDDFQYTPGFLDKLQADELFDALWSGVEWEQKELFLYGRHVRQPRLSAWFADPGIHYSYSGLALEGQPWRDDLDELKVRLAGMTAQPFNSVLLNAYRDGNDSMGWHSDNEQELRKEPQIASLSLGDTRRFLVRRGNCGRSNHLDLEHGSLLLMKGRSQTDYQHSVPKTARQVGPRINLTFRVIY